MFEREGENPSVGRIPLRLPAPLLQMSFARTRKKQACDSNIGNGMLHSQEMLNLSPFW